MKIAKWNWIAIIAAFSAIVGLTILIYFFILVNAAGLLFGEKVNLEIANKIGSFVGGLVGSFWTLTGVLLYYSVIKSQRKESDQAEQRHKVQIDLLNHQKFQTSFFEFLKHFMNIRNELSIAKRHNTYLGRDVNAFEDMSNKLNDYAIYYNNSKSKTPIPNDLVHNDFKSKIIEMCELFILILNEITNQNNKDYTIYYEAMIMNILTYNEISSIILCSIANFDKLGRLKHVLFRSEYWSVRCEIILHQNKEVKKFWDSYRSEAN